MIVLAERIKEHHWEHNDVSCCCEKLPSLGIVFLAKIYAERMSLFRISRMMRKFVRSRRLVMSVVMVMSAPHRSRTSKISATSRHRGHRLRHFASKCTEHRSVNLWQNAGYCTCVSDVMSLGQPTKTQTHKCPEYLNSANAENPKNVLLKGCCGDIQNTAFSFKT